MRITSKGQVTIPQYIRERLGLLPSTEVEFVIDGNAVRIVKVEPKPGHGRGQRIIENLRGRASVSMSTDEIMALTRDGPDAQPQPDADVAQPQPDADVAQPQPDADVAQPQPDADVAQPQPDADVAQPQPDADVAQPQPDADDA
jgi:AbrB family looped-hinge helix DNA binding protein